MLVVEVEVLVEIDRRDGVRVAPATTPLVPQVPPQPSNLAVLGDGTFDARVVERPGRNDFPDTVDRGVHRVVLGVEVLRAAQPMQPASRWPVVAAVVGLHRHFIDVAKLRLRNNRKNRKPQVEHADKPVDRILHQGLVDDHLAMVDQIVISPVLHFNDPQMRSYRIVALA